MATICLTMAASHSPYLYEGPVAWEDVRRTRSARGLIADDVPVDDVDELGRKWQRCEAAFAVLRHRLAAAAPDVVIVFGDDQGEQFALSAMPSLGIFTGERFAGWKVGPHVGLPVRGVERQPRAKGPETWAEVAGHPALARHLLQGLVARGFDLMWSDTLPDEERGIGHAFMRPFVHVRPAFDLPVVPIFVNCYFAPQPTGRRCHALGRAVQELVQAWPEEVRVAVVGSGGLWHTPGLPGAHLDERFDQAILDAVRRGDAEGMAEGFDLYEPERIGPEHADVWSGGTGMRGGLSSGAGETRNWIAAAAVASGLPGTVVDYVPVYASPLGAAFAYWEPAGSGGSEPPIGTGRGERPAGAAAGRA